MTLLNRQVKLKEQIFERNGKEYSVYDLDDTEFETEAHSLYGDSVRIFPPGTAGTMDYKPFRTNIYINKEGVVYNITKG